MKLSSGFVIIFAVAVGAAASILFSLKRFENRGAYRNPAALHPSVLELSDDQILDSASKRRILSGTRAWKEDGNVALTLGHFISKGMDGTASRLCDLYPELSLTFSAEGMATSGDRPTMVIESACSVADNADETEAIWIPISQIKSGKPEDAELRFTSPSDIVVKFRDIPGDWPNYWVLSEIKMINKKDGRSIAIDTATIYKLSSIPVSISWN